MLLAAVHLLSLTLMKLPKILIYISLGLVALLLLLLLIGRLKRTTPANSHLKGSLNINIASKVFDFGEYEAVFNKESGSFSIAYSLTGLSLIENIPGEAFVKYAIGQEDVEETRGSFSWKDEILDEFKIQTIDEVIMEDSLSLILVGQLLNEDKEIDYQLLFHFDSKSIDFKLNCENEDINRSYLTFAKTNSDVIFGFGTQYSKFNVNGEIIPIYITEQGIGRGDEPLSSIVDLAANSAGNWFTSYASIPFFITSQGYGISLDNYEYTTFDFSGSSSFQIQNFSSVLKGSIFIAKTPLEIISLYTSSRGKMPRLPDWIHDGLILGVQGGTDKVLDKYSKLKDAKVEVCGIWIQDWVGQRTSSAGKQLWWNWELDSTRYSNWNGFASKLNEENVKLLGYVNPFLVDVDGQKEHLRNLYQEAKHKSFLVEDFEGEPISIKNTSFSSGIIDLSNTECRNWLKQIIKSQLIDNGFSGWMADYAEALPYDVKLDASTPEIFHNKFAEEWAKLNYEVINENNLNDSVFFFSRSGYSNSLSYVPCFWLGDQMVNWGLHDGIKSAVTGLSTAGISGMSINHSDIGGYTTISKVPIDISRDSELLCRWIELNAFTPVFRSHEGNDPEANAQLFDDQNSIRHISYFSKLFKALKPYRLRLFDKYYLSGIPIVIHPYLLNPEIELFKSYTYQAYYFGEDIFCSPVLDSEVESKRIYLPSGDWVHCWSGKEYNGNKNYEIPCKLGQPPVFVRKGSQAMKLLSDFVLANDLLPS